MPEGDPNFGITRIDDDGGSTHGWQVRVQRRGVKRSRFFSDRRHGGRRQALLKAREHRDQLLEKMPPFSRKTRARRKTSRNASGVVGVSLVTTSGKYGLRYEFWQATWSPRLGERKRVKFSIGKYGDKKAFRLARDARRDGLRAMEE